jgi:hypothetical protein
MNRISSGLWSLALLSTMACHQQDHPKKEPVWEASSQRIEVKGNEVISFPLPDNFQKDEPVISSKPSNALQAYLQKDEAGTWLLRYQSLDGKTGIDRLSIDSEDEKGEKPEHHGGCDGGHHSGFGPPRHHGDKHVHYRLQLEIAVTEDGTQQLKSYTNRERR